MNYINPPIKAPRNVAHKTYYSQVYNQEIGYNVYLPPDYGEGGERYPVAYHLHGWTGNESSDIWTLENIYRGRQAITVFPNNSPVIEDRDRLPVESMMIHELIPYMDAHYGTNENRTLSGFSMGGGMAFYYAVKYPELFSRVTAYAATFHHYYQKEYRGVGEPPEKAAALYAAMMKERRYLEEDGILFLVRQNADRIRGNLLMKIHIGADDVLFCENEIMHAYLNSLDIPHEYKIYPGAGHELKKIL